LVSQLTDYQKRVSCVRSFAKLAIESEKIARISALNVWMEMDN
jgi:hypothetical protein